MPDHDDEHMTDHAIRLLRIDAIASGNRSLAETCEDALDGDPEARAACEQTTAEVG